MCQNSNSSFQLESFKPQAGCLCYNIIVSCLLFFCLLSSAHAAPAKITFLLGDTYGKILVDATREIKDTYPQLRDAVDFHILTSRAIMDKGKAADLSSIASSKTIFILSIMDRQSFERVKPYLRGKCYAVGGAFTKEHENLGLINDSLVCKYYQENGVENIKNMVLMVMNRDLGLNVSYKEPLPVPDFGLYLKKEKRTVENFEDFLTGYVPRANCPWIGIVFYKSNLDSGNTKHLDFIIDRLESKGFNVLPVYGYPSEKPIEMFLFDEKGASRVSAVIGMSLKVGMNPQAVIPVLSRL
ncbi:MAG: cobaltochelatase subunit CobN, partial [Candidatus Desantisbacteria bacterium]